MGLSIVSLQGNLELPALKFMVRIQALQPEFNYERDGGNDKFRKREIGNFPPFLVFSIFSSKSGWEIIYEVNFPSGLRQVEKYFWPPESGPLNKFREKVKYLPNF